MDSDSTVRGEPRPVSWLDHPQRSRLRKAIVQVHLWTALVTGLYVILISLTGSAVVMRREFSRWWAPPRFVAVEEARLSTESLRTSIARSYAGYSIEEIREIDDPRLPVSVTLARDDTRIERRFNPYTGEDLGDPFPRALRTVEWLVDLHDNLLSGQTGRRINGIGGAAFLLIVLTGAVLWWPGRGRWRQSLYVGRGENAQRFLFRLHSTLGFWSFALLLVWGLTAIYFAFPVPFEGLIDALDSDPSDFSRPGEAVLLGLIAGHFGRFGPLGVRFVWMALGLVPIALLVTGFLLWWRRRKLGH